jgi:hypothetical protein
MVHIYYPPPYIRDTLIFRYIQIPKNCTLHCPLRDHGGTYNDLRRRRGGPGLVGSPGGTWPTSCSG